MPNAEHPSSSRTLHLRDFFDRRTLDLHFRLGSGVFANRLNLNAAAAPGRLIDCVDHTHVGQSFATRWFRRAIIQNAVRKVDEFGSKRSKTIATRMW